MIRRIVTCAAVSIWISLSFNGLVAEAVTLPPVDDLMKELKLSDRDREKVRHGEIVDWSPSEGSDRELALGMVGDVKLANLERNARTVRFGKQPLLPCGIAHRGDDAVPGPRKANGRVQPYPGRTAGHQSHWHLSRHLPPFLSMKPQAEAADHRPAAGYYRKTRRA